jgi:hypothetical protein
VPADAADRLLGPEHGAGLAPAVLRSLSVALEGGLENVFWVIAGIALAAAIASLFFPDLPIRSSSSQSAEIAQPAEMTTVPPEA